MQWCSAAGRCLGVVAAMTWAQRGFPDTIVPLDQDRFTSVGLQTDCEGQTSDGDAAKEFEPFVSAVETTQQCRPIPIFTTATAHQTSSIRGSSMEAVAGASCALQSPGTVFVTAVSNFAVTFELPGARRLHLTATLLGDGQLPGVDTLLALTGPEGRTLFSQALAGPFLIGEPTELDVDETLVLEGGTYTLIAAATIIDGIDITMPFFAGESAVNLAIDVSLLGDVNGDEVVNIIDLLALLAAWGPCSDPPRPCPADVDGDGAVGISDLLALLANWG